MVSDFADALDELVDAAERYGNNSNLGAAQYETQQRENVEARVKVLVEACHRAPLATIAHRMDIEGGGGDCVRRILDALAPFKEAEADG